MSPDEKARKTGIFIHLNSVRQDRNFHVNEGTQNNNIVEEETPDLAYGPFDQTSHYDAYNRYTICRKLLAFTQMQTIVGGRLPAKNLGSIIDYNCNVDLLKHELIEVSSILHSQYQVKVPMETLNVLCSATKAPPS